MQTFVLLTKLPPELTKGRGILRKAADEVHRRLKEEVPEVRWTSSYGLFGQYDVVDIFEAPDIGAAMKAATIIRSVGAETETSLAVPWDEFIKTTD